MQIYWMLIVFLTVASILTPPAHANFSCRSYCGNLTVDYPFALRFGCGHPGFRDLLFCINDYLMLHLPSGSYRVLDIDYSFRSLTLHDPHLSDCLTLSLGRRANGFSLEPWRSPYLSPDPDNAFLLLGCSPRSPLFQGFPTRRLPCRNVSGISCEDYYQCPGWSAIGVSSDAVGTRWGPPECCALPFQAIKEINLSKLECEGYSSAYSLAPLRVGGAHQWSYGIRVKYSVQGSEEFCRACEATSGKCGFTGGDDAVKELCMCDGFNSTSNCDSGTKAFIITLP